MSLSQETLEVHLNDPAVLCCRRPGGTTLSAQDFEDPTIFPDMVESNLMTLTDGGLTIQQALGATLTADAEALTQLTPDLVEGAHLESAPEPAASEKPAGTGASGDAPAPAESAEAGTAGSGYVHLHFDKAEGVDLVFPAGSAPVPPSSGTLPPAS